MISDVIADVTDDEYSGGYCSGVLRKVRRAGLPEKIGRPVGRGWYCASGTEKSAVQHGSGRCHDVVSGGIFYLYAAFPLCGACDGAES